MRYIGNKTRLLPFLLRALDKLGIARGHAHDAFAGTAAVGRALKETGWRVASSDLMTYSYVLQRAYVVADRAPDFRLLLATDRQLTRALRSTVLRERAAARHGAFIRGAVRPNGGPPNGTSSRKRGSRRSTASPAASGGAPAVALPGTAAARRLALIGEYLGGWLDPEPGFITRSFSPAGGRMYFTEENAGRIDAARRVLHEWRRDALIDDDAYFILLAALIEAADRVANTAGVYAAYIKSWQPNAVRPLVIAPEPPVRGRGSRAFLGDAAEVARALGPVDLLYVDPPYNSRQYAGYYHVPEIIARGWFDDVPILRGKTGLLSDGTQRSSWCSPRRVADAFRDLLSATAARHVLVSYNSEGLLSAEALHELLAERAAGGRVRRFTYHYRRYRSDSDHAGRRYKGDHVHELLYHAELR